jgi:hypothetical protein
MSRKIRKILYSPGFGAGWTTWESNPEIKKFMLEYEPLIDALERGEDVSEGIGNGIRPLDKSKLHPAMRQFVEDVAAKFGANQVPYLGGARDLVVLEVSGRVRIEEYDGSESVESEGAYSDWL